MLDPAPLSRADRFVELLACPRCTDALKSVQGALECAGCAARYEVTAAVPNLRIGNDACSEKVRGFYTEAPFPGYAPDETLGGLRARAGRSEFAQRLEQAIPRNTRVLEVGCGTGQMSLFLASGGREVVGADLTRASLELGARAAQQFDVRSVHFVETDLHAPGLRAGAFDVVYSSGVLHHTENPRASFASIARLVRPGGTIVLGLYNSYARVPHRLRRTLARLTGYKVVPFDPVLRSRQKQPERARAWFCDQYQHPEEHRHTLREVQRWFGENSIEYLRTYPSALIGGETEGEEEPLFAPAADNWGLEHLLAQIGWAFQLAHEGGLFVVIGRRADASELVRAEVSE